MKNPPPNHGKTESSSKITLKPCMSCNRKFTTFEQIADHMLLAHGMTFNIPVPEMDSSDDQQPSEPISIPIFQGQPSGPAVFPGLAGIPIAPSPSQMYSGYTPGLPISFINPFGNQAEKRNSGENIAQVSGAVPKKKKKPPKAKDPDANKGPLFPAPKMTLHMNELKLDILDDFGNVIKEFSLKCRECGVYQDQDDFHRHISYHALSTPYECGNCFKQHSLPDERKKRPVVCTLCGKTLSGCQRLLWHISVHTDIWRHHCQYCGRGQNLMGDILKHEAGCAKKYNIDVPGTSGNVVSS